MPEAEFTANFQKYRPDTSALAYVLDETKESDALLERARKLFADTTGETKVTPVVIEMLLKSARPDAHAAAAELAKGRREADGQAGRGPGSGRTPPRPLHPGRPAPPV